MTDSQVAHVLAIIRSLDAAQSAAAVNRRHQPRHPFRSTAQIVLLDLAGSPIYKVFTRNISPTGLGLICDYHFFHGERFSIKLPSGPLTNCLCICQATFTRKACDGLYEVGAKFESVSRAAPTDYTADVPDAQPHSISNAHSISLV